MDKTKKQIVFIDCDGVILNTIECSRDMLLEKYGIDKYKHKRENVEDDKLVAKFFAELDWGELLNKSSQINNSFFWINKLYDSKEFYPIIFSMCNSNQEAIQKDKFFNEYLPNIERIYFSPCNKKAELKSLGLGLGHGKDLGYWSVGCGAILIDDDTHNLVPWKEKGGRPVLFSTKPVENAQFPIIDNLGKLFDLFVFDKNGHIESVMDKKVRESNELLMKQGVLPIETFTFPNCTMYILERNGQRVIQKYYKKPDEIKLGDKANESEINKLNNYDNNEKKLIKIDSNEKCTSTTWTIDENYFVETVYKKSLEVHKEDCSLKGKKCKNSLDKEL